jgi:DNA-binding protein HU-beta
VTKAEVISEIFEMLEKTPRDEENQVALDKEFIGEVVEAFFKVVQKSMESGENIYVRGFGSFVNKLRAQKVARNISKNTAMTIEAHYVPSFKPAKTFIERIKNSDKLKEFLKQQA